MSQSYSRARRSIIGNYSLVIVLRSKHEGGEVRVTHFWKDKDVRDVLHKYSVY